MEGIRLVPSEYDEIASDVETVVFDEEVTVAKGTNARQGKATIAIPADVATASAVGDGPMMWRVLTRLDVKGFSAVSESFVFTSDH